MAMTRLSRSTATGTGARLASSLLTGAIGSPRRALTQAWAESQIEVSSYLRM